MKFTEYFNAVAKILDTAVRGELNENDIISIVGESAFGESILSLPQKIKNKNGKFHKSKLENRIKNKPQMPLTDTEKRWLRAVLNDSRVKLFDADIKGLEVPSRYTVRICLCILTGIMTVIRIMTNDIYELKLF